MPWSEFTALLLLATASSFTPGPNTTLSTALAANHGLRRAMRFVLSVPVGWGLMYTACVFGIGALVLALPWLRMTLLLLGVGYLLWLAARLARSGTLTQVSSARLSIGFGQGVLLQFLNVKAWLLALSVAAGWVAGRPDASIRFAQTLPVMLMFALVSNLSYALVGSLLRGWLEQGRRLLMFNRVMAAALVATAGWMVWSART
ncbi:MAG: LysE family transporter [Burkholderiales bacterium]